MEVIVESFDGFCNVGKLFVIGVVFYEVIMFICIVFYCKNNKQDIFMQDRYIKKQMEILNKGYNLVSMYEIKLNMIRQYF